MTPAPKSTTTKKRKYKLKNPPGPDQAVIGWREEELHNLIQNFGLSSDWGIQFPTPNSTALDTPPGYMALYADFFREGNFRLPMSKFIGEVLTGYGLHISQINALGLPRLTHFEFICRANHVEPSFEKFNTFYFVTYTGYSLMNVFDPKDGGAMVVASLLDGRPLWLEQIRDNFLHPSNESLAAYANAILGDDGEGDTDFDVNPTREEPIVLSSADDASFHLIRCYSRAGPQRGPFVEPAADDVDTPVVDPHVGVVNPSKRRKKKREDKSEEKKVEELVVETPRKRPSNSSFLDYVVVSDTLSSLDARVKRSERDPDDDATLTEMMMKKKILEDKKKELDAQAAAALAEKKSKLQKETTAAPSESEIDLGMFSAKTGNRLEKYSITPKSGRSVRKIDISKITPPTSPPSKPLDLSPPRPDLKGNVKEDDVEVEKVGNMVEDVAAGAGRGETHAEGVETEVESSEATPRGTIYTKRVSGSGGGGTSGIHHSPEYTRVQGGSWTNYNPACDDLPHTPQWTLTQGSRMNDLSNCREFYSLSLPPTEKLFQKTCHRMDLFDDHIHAGVNFYATCQEIVREWQAMGEDTLEFEVAEKE
ncbi:hypothetical protein Hanom_Chr05g00435161 [Helianthus anomalus]